MGNILMLSFFAKDGVGSASYILVKPEKYPKINNPDFVTYLPVSYR